MATAQTLCVGTLEAQREHAARVAQELADRVELLERQLSELRAAVKEWGCEKCNYVYPGPPQAGFKCITCPRCGGSTMPLSLMKQRAAESERDELRTELAALKAQP